METEIGVMQLEWRSHISIDLGAPAFFCIFIDHTLDSILHTGPQFNHGSDWPRTSLNGHINYHLSFFLVPLYYHIYNSYDTA